MRHHLETVRWTLRQHWWIAPIALAAALAAAWGSAQLLKPAYVNWRTARAMSQARARLAEHDLARAGVALEVALRGRPSTEAYVLVADYDEEAGLRQAIDARRLAADARPADPDLRLALARTALRFADLPVAREALGQLPPQVKGSLEARRLDASLALLGGEGELARRLLDALRREAPQDEGIRLLDDTLRVRSRDPVEAGRARNDLVGLAADPKRRLAAGRVLLADAAARNDGIAAAEAGRMLAAAPGAAFSDLLDAISGERRADAALVARVRAAAAADPALAAQYGRRLLLESGAAAVTAWFDSLPAAVRDAPALAELAAETAATKGDWAAMERQLQRGAWGQVTDPVIALAFGARAARDHGQKALAARTWTEAVAACGSAPASFHALSRLADIWRWPEAMEAALRAQVRALPDDLPAAQKLIGLLRARGETRALRDLVAERNAGRAPSDRDVADWALLDALVAPPAGPTPGTRALEALRAKNPLDPYVATDWALVLCDLGRPQQAAAIADTLTPDERAAPARAPYLAFIYASAGRKGEAQRAALRALPAAQLLPEEAALLRRAAGLAP